MKVLKSCIIILLFCAQTGHSQANQKLNLNFEQTEKNYPKDWHNYGNDLYKIYLDTTCVKNGKLSVVIENSSDTIDFKALAFILPNNYYGKTIRLSGFIKTENVTNGFAGLWMRIDPEVAFDNMNNRGIMGSTDWKEYEIILPLNPEQTDKIVIGGMLVGRGKMWLDDLKVTIDEKDLDDKNIKIFNKKSFLAEKDTIFNNGSKIIFPALSNEIINNIEILGHVWGFLKYYHPAIASGVYNWDYELFRFLPSYLKLTSYQERDQKLTQWIESFGEIPVCKKCVPTKRDAKLKPDLFWIDSLNLTSSLKIKLKEIYHNRNQETNYYFKIDPNIGNPIFTHENPYTNMPYPDAGFRLLSLYRYWNMIEYFSPNKYLSSKKWNKILKDYIPKFINSKDELEYEIAVLQLIGELNDTHANLWSGGDKIEEIRGVNFAPFKAQFIENKFVVTNYYNPEYLNITKLKIGDIITTINGKDIKSIVDSLKSFYPASNDAAMLRDISEDLLRSSQNKMLINYISDGQSMLQEVALYNMGKLNIYNWNKVNKDDKCFKIIDGNIGYITLANINEEDIPEIKKTLIKVKGIIIDIRNYPSAFVPFTLGSYFISKPTPFVKFTQVNLHNPGEFIFTNPLEIQPDGVFFKGKLVILVNENTQSQAEYTAMAFRAGENSKIIGSTTAGADGNVSEILLPGGLVTMISGIGVYYPDGSETQRIGIAPDIFIEPTIEGIKNKRDELLEKAIEFIHK